MSLRYEGFERTSKLIHGRIASSYSSFTTSARYETQTLSPYPSFLVSYAHELLVLLRSLKMQIHPLQARSDNWMYLVIDESTSEAAVVDPYDWKKMLAFVEEKKAKVGRSEFRRAMKYWLTAIAIGHHVDHHSSP